MVRRKNLEEAQRLLSHLIGYTIVKSWFQAWIEPLAKRRPFTRLPPRFIKVKEETNFDDARHTPPLAHPNNPTMRLTCLSVFLSLWVQLALAFPVTLETRQSTVTVDQATYNQLERYAKFCVAALQVCARPLGTSLVKTVRRSSRV